MLRPYQATAIAKLRTLYAEGRRAPLLVLACGSGKTHIAASIIQGARARGNRTIFLAHRTELIDQTVAKLAEAGIANPHVIRAGGDTGDASTLVTVASIQTLTRRSELPDAALVIWDEIHHVLANTWASLARRYANARMLGLSATPSRGDNRPLGDVCDSMVVGASIAELTRDGYLVPCRVWAPSEPLDGGELAMEPTEAYTKLGDGQPCVVFATTLEHAASVAKSFNDAGTASIVVDGKMSNDERAARLRGFAAGTTRVVVNVYCLTEGWNCPAAAVCILARRPLHDGTFLQMVGRVLRPHPGKTHATLIDLAGSVHLHGLPDAERTYSLDGHGITRADRTPLRQCPACGFVTTGSPATCATCGAVWPTKLTPLPQSIGVGLGEVTRAPPRPMRPKILENRFRARCRSCQRWVGIGERIAWIKGLRTQCERCYLDALLQGVQ